MIFVHGLSS